MKNVSIRAATIPLYIYGTNSIQPRTKPKHDFDETAVFISKKCAIVLSSCSQLVRNQDRKMNNGGCINRVAQYSRRLKFIESTCNGGYAHRQDGNFGQRWSERKIVAQRRVEVCKVIVFGPEDQSAVCLTELHYYHLDGAWLMSDMERHRKPVRLARETELKSVPHFGNPIIDIILSGYRTWVKPQKKPVCWKNIFGCQLFGFTDYLQRIGLLLMKYMASCRCIQPETDSTSSFPSRMVEAFPGNSWCYGDFG